MLRTLFRVFLVLALLLGQQAALVHAISHVPGNIAAGAPNPEQPAHSYDCEQCLSYSQLHAVGRHGVPLPAGIFAAAGVLHVVSFNPRQHTEQFYSARAPPALL